ncbi:hypothetical protein [Paeniglutamicibacter psychrophenolicus]|uniref:hypothetical protein n=1 Tax=Paeniglutamicibacter psychrophenolicus TaxID=257454 RepID=UPI002789E6A9|nr:hypothetical protein [Paeniglutamicibacter psychrophenolicus]MDQ0094663.1 hypothetical protein [Paeniglutamicibacter psychrophenolicus]
MTNSPLEDFLQAYRWMFYLMVLAFAIRKKWGPVRPLVIVTWLLIGMATLKSILTSAVLGPNERPGLLTENNFELALFSGLVVALYRHIRHKFLIIFTLGTLTLLSGSRSGAVAFLILCLFAISQAQKASLLVKYLLACLIPLLVLIPLQIFASRNPEGGQIDRLNFFDVFLSETQKWTSIEWLFGTVPISPVSREGCDRLSFYQALFSTTGDGSCYSVIFHAFTLRVIFDAGIFGFLLVIWVVWFALRKSRVQRTGAIALVLIAISNGFSVSGFNSPYIMIPVVLAILTAARTNQYLSNCPKERLQSETQVNRQLDRKTGPRK